MAEMETVDSYLSRLETNHFTLVKNVDPEVFLDYLRQHQILTDDDSQLVRNYFVNQTRRARMRCFLDILRLKGPENIEMFWKLLGWEYPHVYREIFREDPFPAPLTYRQSKKSRLSCDLNQLLTFGFDMAKVKNHNDNLADQIKGMEEMLQHQKNEIEDLERENQRLRQYERDNHQTKDKLKTLTATNDEIKEENRQFLHEIRKLTLEVQKLRDQECKLQAQLDEKNEQVHEKCLELNRKSKEENALRDKLDRAVKASIRFSPAKSKISDIVHNDASVQQQQQNLHQQLEILMHDIKQLEETNSGLCDQLQYMQNLLDEVRLESDQMHRNVVVLEHTKNTMESRQNTNIQKLERYFHKIKELEEEKKKLEEDRVQMQIKMWEMSMESQKQFEHLHKAETRFDNLQQSYDQFRQEHRTCIPGEPSPQARPRGEPLPVSRHPRSPAILPAFGKEIDDPFKFFASFYASALHLHPESSSSQDAMDGDLPVNRSHSQLRTDSLIVNPSASMRLKNIEEPSEELEKEEDSEQDDKASTASDVSTFSSTTTYTFDVFDLDDPNKYKRNDTKAAQSGNFFLRSNVQDDGDADCMPVKEGEIIYVDETGEEHWIVMRVDKATGKVRHDERGKISNPDKLRRDSNTGQPILRGSSSDKKQTNSLSRSGAIRRDGLKHQHSNIVAFSTVCPMKATCKLPVLLLCPPSIRKTLLNCMETTAQDWAIIAADDQVEKSQLFSDVSKHYIIPWEERPKHPNHCVNLHKFIILAISLHSLDALSSLKVLLGDPNLTLDYEPEVKQVTEILEMVQRAGLHGETLLVAEEPRDREAFWKEVKTKVLTVQDRVFWLETSELRLDKQ